MTSLPIQDQLDPVKPLPRILVAEDDTGIRNLNQRLLLQSGYEVDTAEDGAMAWDALQANRYDLLITDQQMPKVSGIELVGRLRSARMNLRVILVSGAMPSAELSRKPWLQLDATVTKPFAPNKFLETVKDVLHGAPARVDDDGTRRA